jgi:hypothetical protein
MKEYKELGRRHTSAFNLSLYLQSDMNKQSFVVITRSTTEVVRIIANLESTECHPLCITATVGPYDSGCLPNYAGTVVSREPTLDGYKSSNLQAKQNPHHPIL